MFRTKIKSKDYSFQINHNSKILSIGSCFAKNIAERLDYFKFEIKANPFGILFNPISISNALLRILENDLFTENDLIFSNERFFNYELHSEFSSPSKKSFLDKINKKIIDSNRHLIDSDLLIITLGTAWVYKLKSDNRIVANCHKQPASFFDKKLLSVDEIYRSISEILHKLKLKNPKLNVLLTVSPVRHLKDGMSENHISKGRLIDACLQLVEDNNHIQYFPSYEIIMDDLRDYRFFDKDMVHPSELAIDYIWSVFDDSFFTQNTQAINKEIEVINKMIAHRPFNKESEQFNTFKKKMNQKIEILQNKMPNIKF